MYLDHFGLREAPFRITPHTEFFFAGANRGATLEALIYAITHDEGIVKVSGEVGSGKTMLCRMLLEKLPENVETVYLANPSLTRDEILHAIAEELHVPLQDGHAHLLLRSLQDRLIDIYATGRQVVVMIDEAHAMPPETLEEVRLLSNLESNRHKLLHIVLFGQPELDEHLGESSMRQLKERITHNFALEPLRRSDIANYLMFRIRAAGYRGPDLFTPGAIQLISKASEGLTRRINILADKALLSAFSENKHQIDNKQVKAAIRDAQFNPMRDSSAKPKTWIVGACVITAIAVLAYLAGSYKSTHPADSTTVTQTPAASSTAPNPADRPNAESSGSANTTVVKRTSEAGASGAAATASTTPEVQMPTLAERLAASREWLDTAPNSHYFIQLLSTDGSNQHDVEQFLDNIVRTLDSRQIRVYRSTLSGHDRIGVIYGDYPSRVAASADLAKLAKSGLESQPYVRSVSKIR
ncbi:MAG: AAA family ATPase [Propionivibrio sp.]|uniref:AAA family ATPase n=1 Tax=Propionivibrio sp. TaxID=2212460 RepID=UPI002600FD7F|nr:AAA family ATPase [Propionivibrio sp.]MBL0207209.1 AAA family ATPase [Propionivibrio sp.]